MKVNMDQFAMDTRWREWKWTLVKQHPVAYWINRLEWYAYPKLKHVSKFPIHVDFESSSLCNLKCPMCYRPHRASQDDGLMNFDVYAKAIDECAEHGLYSIRLSWRGEPAMHKGLAEMVAYAKQQGIKEVSFITNGTMLTPDLSRALVDAGLDYLSVSIDGIEETYENIRKPAKFYETVERLRTLRRLRDEFGNGFPRVRTNSIWSAVKDTTKEYNDILSPVTDYMTVNPDYDHGKTKTAINPAHVCHYLYQRMTVMWDGSVPLCICDKSKEILLGNIATDSLAEMWQGEAMTKARKDQVNGKTDTIAPCSKCQRSLTTQLGDQRPQG